MFLTFWLCLPMCAADKAAGNIEQLKGKAQKGDATAQNELGDKYYYGNGVEKDSKAAVGWYRRAANQGHAEAQFSLGYMYDEGKGVPKDDKEAAKWYRRAAVQGKGDAQHYLGLMYYNGEGVGKDIAQAYLWWTLATEQNHEEAKKWKGEAAAKLTPDETKKINKWVREWSAWKLARG